MGRAKRILSIDDLTNGEINRLFFNARSILAKNERSNRFLQAVMMNSFFEASTRTRLSFEMAAHRLGVKTLTFHSQFSSMAKGETIEETIHNLLALNPNILVVRQSSKLDPSLFLDSEAAIINGGDGTNEHPSQALLDCFTLLEHFRTDDLFSKKILIIGDVLHSRVAHSNIKLMTRLRAQVSLLAPLALQMKEDIGQKNQFSSFDEIDDDFDVVMCLRMQKERMEEHCHISDTEFFLKYGLTPPRFLQFGEKCVLMHPGPMNVGVEIDQALVKHERSLILKQVSNGVLMRAALIDFCLP